jgi:hypothetical protein
MAFVFKPAIYKGGSLTTFPHPVMDLTISSSWKFDEHTVPLKSGVLSYGHSRVGDQIVISGQMGTQDGTPKISEEDMFGVLSNLRTVLNVASRSDLFEFFIYHDTGTSTYRKFKSCWCVSFDWSMGDKDRVMWPWGCVLKYEDTTLYSTAPGA